MGNVKARTASVNGGSSDHSAAEGQVIVSESSNNVANGNVIASIWAEARRRSSSGRALIAIRGGAWIIVGYVATQLLRTVATLVLARHFLGPEAFGVVGLVGVFLAGLSMFSELGLIANIVQHPRGDDPDFLNTAFSIQAGRGVGIWLTAALAAYPLALFYKQPEVLPLLAVAAFSELIRGMTSTAAWTLTRHVKLRNITLLTICAETIAFGLCVLWAVISPSAWALVARTIASAVVYAVGTHYIATPAVKFGWDQAAANDILHFGGWISVSTAAHFMASQGERLILGKFVTPAELGCFSLALVISSAPANGIGQLVNQIFLPMISQSVRTSRIESVRDFLRARRLFFGLALIAGGGFLICAKPFVALMLSTEYRMAGWMLQALGLRVALDLFAAPASSVILAYGESRYSATANTARLIVMVIGIWIAFTYFGLREAVIALIVAQTLSYFPLIIGLKTVLPEVALAELRWYGLLVVLLALASLVTFSHI
jgi:O-antigen/teichoic acid export membrane protein